MDQAAQLRNLIKKNQQKPLARVITVTSGKGGVGKSSLSTNLAIQLQRMGNRVVILDADFGLANIEVMLGIRPRSNLADLIFKGKSLQEIITPGPLGIGFISGGSGIQELVNLTKGQVRTMVEKLNELDEIADVIIVDTGAGISDSVLEFVTISSEVLLVVTPDPTSIIDSYALLKTLDKREDFNAEESVIKMVANRVEDATQGNILFQKLSAVVREFLNVKLEYLGAIPQDTYLSRGVMTQNPVSISYPNSYASQAIFNLATVLSMKQPTMPQERKGISGFFSKLVHKLGK